MRQKYTFNLHQILIYYIKIYSLHLFLVIQCCSIYFLIYELFSKFLIWSYYFSYKCIKILNVQHNDMAIFYNNLNFFSNLFKAINFLFLLYKTHFFVKKTIAWFSFLIHFSSFFLKSGVIKILEEFYKKIWKLITFLL